jgi:hypothetical protein
MGGSAGISTTVGYQVLLQASHRDKALAASIGVVPISVRDVERPCVVL